MKAGSALLLAPIVIISTAAAAAEKRAPLIQTVSAPPPPAPIVIGPSLRDQSGPPMTFTITILTGRITVWSGTLRVGPRNGNSSYSQTKNEALPICPGIEYRRPNYGGNGERLNVRIDRRNNDGDDSYTINVDWTRPLPDCQGEGASSVGVSRSFNLDPGKSVDFQGDGGFVVRVSRKD